MEIRGLGIINIREIFGPKSVARSAGIDLIIRLKKWRKGFEVDRLGLKFADDEFILGEKVPQLAIPVAPGRNIATLDRSRLQGPPPPEAGLPRAGRDHQASGQGPHLRDNMKNALKDNRFLIITGLSGSGKTVVSRFLEDLGYYCVDNLPAKLIPEFVDLWHEEKVEIDQVALVMDIREPRFVTEFPRVLREIRKSAPARLVFLDASDECPGQAIQRDPAAPPADPEEAHPGGRPAGAEAAPGRSRRWPTRSSTPRT